MIYLWRLVYLSVLLSGTVGVAQARNYYALPTADGSECTDESPCSLKTAISKAEPGDDVVLKDGVYNEVLHTVRNGTKGNPITIRAENRHKAVMRWPYGGLKFAQLVNIGHDWTILRGIKVDGNNKSWDSIRVSGSHSNFASNVIVEDTFVQDAGIAGGNVHDAENVIWRHCRIEMTGGGSQDGSAWYISSATRGSVVKGLQIYGCRVSGTRGGNLTDIKQDAYDVYVHHNIWENHGASPLDSKGWAGDGMIRSASRKNLRGAGNRWENNIIRNTSKFNYAIRLQGNRVDVKKNVFYNMKGSNLFIEKRTSEASKVSDNIICNGPSLNQVERGENRFNRPMDECKAEEKRILREMEDLPKVGSGWGKPAEQ